jgi:hypothetical protein
MKFALINGGGILYSVEEDDIDFISTTYLDKVGSNYIQFFDPDHNVQYIKKRGDKSARDKDVWIEDPSFTEKAVRFERYPIIDMKYIELIKRNPALYYHCMIAKKDDIMSYLNYEDKINLLVNTLLNKELSLSESFTLIQSPPSDEILDAYMKKLAYLILEQQALNGEISDLNLIKIKAHELCELTVNLEDIEQRSLNYKSYMRYLLTKDDYINITAEEVKQANLLVRHIHQSSRQISRYIPSTLKGYATINEEIINDSCKLIKYSACKGKFTVVKYVDKDIRDFGSFIRSGELDLETSFLSIGSNPEKPMKIIYILIDKNFNKFIYAPDKALNTLSSDIISSLTTGSIVNEYVLA